MITKLDQLVETVQKQEKKRLAVAYAEDTHTLKAVDAAFKLGLIQPVLVGNRANINAAATEIGVDLTEYIIQEEQNDVACVARAVQMIHQGEAEFIMKGLVSSDKYMKGILDKQNGLVPPKATLSHVTVVEVPTYHKLLMVSDVAVIIEPSLNQKVEQVKYVCKVGQILGIETPKIAILSATEQMLPNIASCYDGAIIAKMWSRGQITECIVDGPLALDVAICREAVAIKKLDSPVGGEADGLIFPTLEAGNIFFKAATKLMNASMAGMVVGASVPCVLTSRGDSDKNKIYSIALSALSARK